MMKGERGKFGVNSVNFTLQLHQEKMKTYALVRYMGIVNLNLLNHLNDQK